MSASPAQVAGQWLSPNRPRLGFLGVGWIGRNRLAALADEDCAEIVAIADPSTEASRLALKALPSDRPEDLFESAVDGSFHDFVVERFHGTRREVVAGYPDPWGGRALIDWVRRLGENRRFAPAARRFVEVAAVVDRIYGR